MFTECSLCRLLGQGRVQARWEWRWVTARGRQRAHRLCDEHVGHYLANTALLAVDRDVPLEVVLL